MSFQLVHVGLCDTVDLGNGRVDAYCEFEAGDPLGGEPRRWRAIIRFDFHTGAATCSTGPDGERPDEEQFAMMKGCLVKVGAYAGERHGYTALDQRFSTN